MPDQPSRRAVLRLGGVGLAGAVALSPGLAACTSSSGGSTPSAPLTPDEQARASATAREEQLADRASRTTVRHPELTVAADAATAHAAHAKALRETLVPSPASSPSGSGGAPAVPASRTDAARELATAESAAADAHRQALAVAGVSGALARLLASVAASDAGFSLAVRDQGDPA